MSFIPSEVGLGGVFFPPYLLAGMLGVLAAVATGYLLNRYRLSRFFFYPPLVFLCLAVLYTVAVATFLIPA